VNEVNSDIFGADLEHLPIALLNEIAKLGFQDALEIIALIEMMERQNQGRVVGKLSDEGAGSAGIVIRNALITRITILVARPYASLREGDRHLRRAFDDLLKLPAVRKHIDRDGNNSDLPHAERLWADVQIDPQRATVEHFRHKYTAHLGEPRPGVANPDYATFFDFARKTARVMEKLAHAVGGTKETLDEHYDDFIRSAQIFWKPWDPIG
jgi:AbiU2